MLSAKQLNGVAVSWNAIREIESTGNLGGKNGINAQGWLGIACLLWRLGVSLLKLIYQVLVYTSFPWQCKVNCNGPLNVNKSTAKLNRRPLSLFASLGYICLLGRNFKLIDLSVCKIFFYIIILRYDYDPSTKEKERERIRSKKRLLVLNNSRSEEATLTHLADHITMVKRRNLAVYSHISKEKISVNNNRRKQSLNQSSCCPPSPTHILFLCHLLYYILCISNIPYEAQESKFICFWM